jgi:hypothetical protein
VGVQLQNAETVAARRGGAEGAQTHGMFSAENHRNSPSIEQPAGDVLDPVPDLAPRGVHGGHGRRIPVGPRPRRRHVSVL